MINAHSFLISLERILLFFPILKVGKISSFRSNVSLTLGKSLARFSLFLLYDEVVSKKKWTYLGLFKANSGLIVSE